MKAVFKAVRALRGEALHYDLRELKSKLQFYESSHRGHQHQLDELASARFFNGDPQRQARADKLRFTTQSLLYALTRYVDKPELQSPTFQPLLEARDETGLLAELTEEALLSRALRSPKAGYWMKDAKVELGAPLSITITIAHHESGLSATRSLQVANGGFNTLGSCVRGLLRGHEQLQALYSDLSSWPEFTKKSSFSLLEMQVREQFQTMMSGYSPEEQVWLSKNWDELKPTCLRRSSGRF